MNYKTIGGSKKASSQIIFGCATLPFLTNQDNNDFLDAVYGMGINTFDLARGYGGAEASFGRWLKASGLRDQVVIITKCGHPDRDGRKRITERDILEDLQMSLEMLGTDYIDVYLLHRDDPKVPVGEIAEIFHALHEEGRIGAYGGSNWTHERIAEVNAYAKEHDLVPMTVSSPNFGLADQVEDPWGGGCITISGPANKAARDWYAANQMPVIAYSSLGRGLFSGKLKSADAADAASVLDPIAMKGYGYPENFERLRRCEVLAQEKGATVPQIAMAWIYSQKINTYAVVSTTKPGRMQENINALQITLTEEEADWLDLGGKR